MALIFIQLLDMPALRPLGDSFVGSAKSLWLYVICGAAIALAYIFIVASLLYLIRRRHDSAFRRVFCLLSALISALAVTQLLNVFMMWFPLSGFEAVGHVLTAIIAIGVAAAFWRHLPRLMQIPTRAQLAETNRRLSAEISERQRAEGELQKIRRDLEFRVLERTKEFAVTNANLRAEIVERRRVEEERSQLLERERAQRAEAEEAQRRLAFLAEENARLYGEAQRAVLGLTAAKEAADAASLAKSAIVAHISHEIRTPLGAIMGFAELMADPVQSSSGKLRCIATIRRNADQLLRLLDDILDLAKVEAGKLQIENMAFSLSELLGDVIATLQYQAEEKGIGLSLSIAEAVAKTIRTDPTRLRQILMNLVGNAVKFTERGHVQVDVYASKGDRELLLVDVRDTGKGLSSEQIASLFQPFGQAEASISRRFGGTGLGLALSRQLARALGGDITLVESVEGEGSLFRLSIDLVTVGKRSTAGRSEAVKTVEESATLQGKRVLLVEDGPDNQILLSHFLKLAGASVELANDGREGVAKALALKPDVVLMDIQMPELDGYQATAELRRASYGGSIIALTAHAMKGERERCLAAGCDDYLAKPVDRTLLVERTAAYARTRRAGSSTLGILSTGIESSQVAQR